MSDKIVKLKDGGGYLYPISTLIGIDSSNLIAQIAGTTSGYTATQDCFATYTTNYIADTAIYIDGVQIEIAGNQQNIRKLVMLKKGQTLTNDGNIKSLWVWGIKQY